MATQSKLDTAYMTCAYEMSKLSNAKRKKVGAIIVSPEGGIIAEGVNGMPSGFDNCCEYEQYRISGSEYSESKSWVDEFCTPSENGTWITPRGNTVRKHLITNPEVLHAESNAILKVARSTNSSVGSTLYTTLSPCLECAKLIIQAGITRVVYSEQYPYIGHSGAKRPMGLKLLEKANIKVEQLTVGVVVDDDLDHQDEGRGYDENKPWKAYRP